MTTESSNKQLIEIVEKLISNFDPTPIIVNEDYPLRWESNIFIEDYDFSENYLDLQPDFEKLNGKYLSSVGTAIEINKLEDGSFELSDGIFMIEPHTWCSKLNTSQNYPSFSIINEKFDTIKGLISYLVEKYN
jgi:hypothetical protein